MRIDNNGAPDTAWVLYSIIMCCQYVGLLRLCTNSLYISGEINWQENRQPVLCKEDCSHLLVEDIHWKECWEVPYSLKMLDCSHLLVVPKKMTHWMECWEVPYCLKMPECSVSWHSRDNSFTICIILYLIWVMVIITGFITLWNEVHTF